MPQNDIPLALIVHHVALREEFLSHHSIVAERFLALEDPHASFAASVSPPLDQVDNVDVSFAHSLGSREVEISASPSLGVMWPSKNVLSCTHR